MKCPDLRGRYLEYGNHVAGRCEAHPCPAENGFILIFDSWLKALTTKTKIIVRIPLRSNRYIPTREYLQRLQDFAAQNNLWIVADEVYWRLILRRKNRPAPPPLQAPKKRTLIVHSLSKSYAMTGWRVGFLAAPAKVIGNALESQPKLHHLCGALHSKKPLPLR